MLELTGDAEARKAASLRVCVVALGTRALVELMDDIFRLDSIAVDPPTWLERLRGITFEAKIRHAVQRLERQRDRLIARRLRIADALKAFESQAPDPPVCPPRDGTRARRPGERDMMTMAEGPIRKGKQNLRPTHPPGPLPPGQPPAKRRRA